MRNRNEAICLGQLIHFVDHSSIFYSYRQHPHSPKYFWKLVCLVEHGYFDKFGQCPDVPRCSKVFISVFSKDCPLISIRVIYIACLIMWQLRLKNGQFCAFSRLPGDFLLVLFVWLH